MNGMTTKKIQGKRPDGKDFFKNRPKLEKGNGDTGKQNLRAMKGRISDEDFEEEDSYRK